MRVVVAKAQAFGETSQRSFKTCQQQVLARVSVFL